MQFHENVDDPGKRLSHLLQNLHFYVVNLHQAKKNIPSLGL